jgi:hypothetical protein
MMNAEASSVRLDRTELDRYLDLYDLEAKYLFGKVTQKFQKDGTLTPYDFFAIILWKSNRAKTKIKKGLADAGKSVQELMREVSQANTPENKLETLLQIWGIWLPMASAILTVCYPEDFTVLDYRAWEVLSKAAVDGLPPHYPRRPEEYLQYCEACRKLAPQVGLSLRDLDRALWAKSWENGLLELITTSGD